MANFTNYTEKTEPVDTDLALIYDTPAKVNKKFTFGNLWKWIAKKIVSEGISQLETANKTIPGAINELNSKKQNTSMLIENTSNLYEHMLSNCGISRISFYSIPSKIKVENGSPDGAGGFGIAYKSSSENYGIIIIFSYDEAVYMKIKTVTWDNWKKVKFIK